MLSSRGNKPSGTLFLGGREDKKPKMKDEVTQMVESRHQHNQKKSGKQGENRRPNSNIERVDVTDRKDLERFF